MKSAKTEGIWIRSEATVCVHILPVDQSVDAIIYVHKTNANTLMWSLIHIYTQAHTSIQLVTYQNINSSVSLTEPFVQTLSITPNALLNLSPWLWRILYCLARWPLLFLLSSIFLLSSKLYGGYDCDQWESAEALSEVVCQRVCLSINDWHCNRTE